MGTSRSGRSWRLGTAAAGLAVAVTVLILAVGSSQARSPRKPTPGSSCAHPLESGMATDGAAIGDTKDFTVTTKQISKESSVRPEPRILRVAVNVHNPRVLLCGVEVTDIFRNPATGAREKRVSHPTISPHGGLSSPVTESATVVLFSVRVYGRLAPPPKSGTKPTSGCTLDTAWDGVGDGGDKQDYTVAVKETGSGTGPYTAQVEVKVLKPKVEICSATVSWYEIGKEASGLQSTPVTIGVHGGLSSRVTLPVGATRAFATVTGRMG
jgi:hypothetical protein